MTENLTVIRMLTRRDAIDQGRIDVAHQPTALHEGEAWLAVDRIALTTNNITYGAFGDAMHYWDFFPSGVDGQGHIPVWGLADVVASRASGVAVGERFYGFFPIASHVRMQPVQVKPRGFVDGTAHRQPLPAAYNQYVRCSEDPAYAPDLEDFQILWRPLFVTSVLLADFLADNDFFGAKRVLLSSGSSKTAFGTAYCLRERDDIERVALTSGRNRGFVERLGCYHRVLDYSELPSLDTDTPTLYVDFAGDAALRHRVHTHLGDALRYDCVIGATQHSRPADTDTQLPGPKPVFFFAPAQAGKRQADWSPAELSRRLGEAQTGYFAHLRGPGAHWVQVVQHEGFEAARDLIAELTAGRTAPNEGHVVALR